MKITNELERKLDASDGFELPELDGDPLEPRVFSSVYYDTTGYSLAHAGITLRRRTEHGRSLWQLKLPSAESRLELEQAGGPAGPPAEFTPLLFAHLRNGPLERVAELHTRRRGLLVAHNGTTAEVTVDAVSVMDARRVAGRFVEVEIELREGDPKGLDEIAREVLDAGARPSNGLPKALRAIGIEPAPASDPEAPFEALSGLLRTQLREILAHDPGTRLGKDPESLHDMRVATRRARALLRAGRALIASDTEVLRAELKWLGGELATVRDLDVLLERLRTSAASLEPPDRAAATSLLRRLARSRSRARKKLLEALDGERYLSLLDRFEEEIERLEPSDEQPTLAALAKKQSKHVRRSVRELGDEPADEELHAIRKLVKRMRYAHELAGHKKVVRQAKSLQDVLGEHQDAVVAEDRLRALAAKAAAPEALAAGALITGERQRREEARRAWRGAWRKLDRAA